MHLHGGVQWYPLYLVKLKACGYVVGMVHNQMGNGGIALDHVDSMVIKLGDNFEWDRTRYFGNDVGLYEGSHVLNEWVGSSDLSFPFPCCCFAELAENISDLMHVHTKVGLIILMYVYLIGHRSDICIHTYVGVTRHFETRLQEHNVHTVWFPIMVIEVADHQSSNVQTEWRCGKHGVEPHIVRGFKLVKKYCAVAYVANLKLGLLSQMPEGPVKNLSEEFWNNL